MSNVSPHRRPTPVPTESVFVFGREISQLPAISESPPENSGERALLRFMEPQAGAIQGIKEMEEEESSTPPPSQVKPAASYLQNDVENDPEPVTTPSSSIPEEEVRLMGESSSSPSEKKKTEGEVKLNISGHSLHHTESESSYSAHGTKKNGVCMLRAPEENVQEALLTLFFVTFHVAWSIGVGFWHWADGETVAAQLTFVIVIVGAIFSHMTYIFDRSIAKRKIWSTSKIAWIIFLVPGLLPICMALANLVFAAREAKDHTFVRPWTNTRTVFLVESLALAIPQSILQITLLMEDYENFPSIKGAILAAGLFVLSAGITWGRIRYDSSERVDRFAVGTEKYIRYAVVWASKVLWLITCSTLVVSIRILYGKENIAAIGLSLICLQLFFELPLFFSTLAVCQKLTGLLFSLFFLIPQFAALVTLILWVNVDMTVYKFNIGSCILGLFFGTESLAIMGWLLDRCMGRDVDFFPIYPHLFGNLYLNCCK